ncbi:MAG: hypothetical protein JSR58_02695 [Verrucomicrobia bacterium]|nr:hypothetical protein [Verrucomicrobiota bacterium]
MTGPISGDYSSYVPNAQTPVGQLFADLQAMRELLNSLPPDSPYAKFLQRFITSCRQYFSMSIHIDASKEEIQKFMQQFFNESMYRDFANGNWADPSGYLTKENLQKMAQYLAGFSLPSIPPMSNLDQMLFTLLSTMGQAPNGSPLQKLYDKLAELLFSKGSIDPGTFLNTVLPWMQQVIQDNFADFPGLTQGQKTDFIQNFYNSYVGLLKDWGNPNAKDFIKQLEAIFKSNQGGLSDSKFTLISIIINAALSHNPDDANFLSPFESTMLDALIWAAKIDPKSVDSQLANYLLSELANLGPDGTLDQLKKWAKEFAYNPQNGWIWTASQDALSRFGEITGAPVTSKQYQSELASWLKDHKAEKGSPLYQFVEWARRLIDTFRTQDPNGKVPTLEDYLDQYINSDIYKMFPGLTPDQVKAFYQSDMPPGMQPPT